MVFREEVGMDTKKVLEEYENSNDGKRVDLFLAYRELREQFCRIDQESPHDDFAIIKFPWSRKRRVPRAA